MDFNKIYCENNLVTTSRLPNNSIDMVLGSPPYDNLRKYNGYAFEFEKLAKELWRVVKKNGVVVWIVGDGTKNGSESGSSFKQALYFMSLGFKLHDTMIFRKENYAPKTHKRYEQSFEYMFVLVKGSVKTFNPIMVPCKGAGTLQEWGRKGSNVEEGVFRRRDERITVKSDKIKENVWTYACGFTQTKHPAPFPEKLAQDHILSWSNEGDIIYDPFMGSGTTAKMALINNRKYVGSEVSEEYCKEAEIRIDKLFNDLI